MPTPEKLEYLIHGPTLSLPGENLGDELFLPLTLHLAGRGAVKSASMLVQTSGFVFCLPQEPSACQMSVIQYGQKRRQSFWAVLGKVETLGVQSKLFILREKLEGGDFLPIIWHSAR